ncbi:hypothetical protein [Streptomyces sp. DG1A-41]|uniref:hypothetical protein n=1 Tax=Streptomyces sp. DG1A-41 TaxID=3125779 RepID=UPI0030D12A30
MTYKHLALEQLALRPGDTVVDAGCGTGRREQLPQPAGSIPAGIVVSRALPGISR